MRQAEYAEKVKKVVKYSASIPAHFAGTDESGYAFLLIF